MYTNDLQTAQSTSSTPSSSSMPSTIPVDLLIEQQFKLTQLQQLQQLQNQIFQQQIALISGQHPILLHDPTQDLNILRDTTAQMNSLPTPGSSTELRPQPASDYISPMTLHYIDGPQDPYQTHPMDAMPSYFQARNTMSAPANIAFPSSSVSLPTDLDFDISPLTSPWLGANQQSIALPPTRNPPISGKRAASPSSDDIFAKPASKKQSPAIKPTISTAVAATSTTMTTTSARRHSRASRSGLPTPALSHRDSTHAEPTLADSPSPVDIFMLPPAPPSSHSTSTSSNTPSVGTFPSNPHLDGLTPVTPSTIMNLGRLGINKLPSPTTKADPKSTVRPKADNHRARIPKNATNAAAPSPSLKAILPATNKSSSSSTSGGVTTTSASTTGSTAPVVQVRKTSHKAAEQKRRDSLKTTFDDLRGLLPPIPLPSDDNFPDERILPGALPPRGPPKAGGEGPNKGVSKLQLLMCGNDYIRQLKARVERRDDEIACLRQEVARLRMAMAETKVRAGFGEDVDTEGVIDYELDLERDLDAVENVGNGSFFSVRRSTSVVADDEADEDMADI